MTETLSFLAPIYLRSSDKTKSSWHFVDVSKDISDEIKVLTAEQPRKGFGSVKVEVKIGFVTWKTSIFPSKETGTYILPIKKAVRDDLHIGEGDKVRVGLRVLI